MTMLFYNQEIARLRQTLYPRPSLTKRIVAAKRLIDNRYAEQLDLEMLCRIACVSRYHFIRLFRKYYGCTPHQYVQDVRVARAKRLLREGWSVQAVCHAVGYESPTSFSSLFRRATGVPPSRIG